MKVATYNLNGIRAALGKGWMDWVKEQDADVYCIQETKAQPDQVPNEIFEQAGYNAYWESAEKKGYSGVMLLTKQKPNKVVNGCGNPLYDKEGRVIRADFDNYSVISVYHPSGTTGDVRQEFKMEWLDFFQKYINDLRKEIPNLIVCGDYNICHTEIDIHNPVSNKNSSGFLPEEREWIGSFIDSGFIDTFRALNPEPHHYTWWSYRFNSRAQNKGWRIDYIMAAEPLKDKIKAAEIQPFAVHSDHCPQVTEFDL